jgi:hypothetical protein
MWITIVCLGHSCFVVCGSTTAIVSFIICSRARSSNAACSLATVVVQASFSVQLQEVVKCLSVDYFKV